MRMKLSALSILCALTAAGCGEGDDDYEVGDSSVIGGDAALPKPDAQAPGSPEAGSGLPEAGAGSEGGVVNDAGASFDAGGSSDSGTLDASNGGDASADSGGSDAGMTDSGGAHSDAGNTDAGGGDAGAAPTFTRVYQLFQTPCVGCHGASGRGGLNMANKNTAHMELTSPGNAEGTCAGNNRKRVVAGMPDASLLIKKLEGTQDCGERMPEGRAPLTAAQIAEVRAWISAGALNN